MKKLKIIVVDDHDIFRNGLTFFIEVILKYTLLAQYKSGTDFVHSDLINQADLVLMDINMPEMSGFETVRKAHKHNSKMKIIAITSYNNVSLKELIMAGFKGCVSKDAIYAELPIAITKVMDGKLYFNNDIRLMTMENESTDDITN